MTIKVSVILPSLNVSPYIEECLQSVRRQTLREIEILCIDAGSTDGTREIIAAHAAEDSRIRLLGSKIRSVGYQLNLGLAAAQGEYIGIVETDDYIALGMYELLYAAAQAHRAEIVLNDYQAFWGETTKSAPPGAGDHASNGRGERQFLETTKSAPLGAGDRASGGGGERQFLNKSVARPAQYNRPIDPAAEQEVFDNDMSIWAGLYSRDFLLRNNIREQETPGAAYQDQGFWFQAFVCAKRLLYLQNAAQGYRYRLDNPRSSVHSKRLTYAICEEFSFIKEQLEKRGLWEKYKATYKRLQFNRYLWNYLRLEEPEQLQFLQRFRAENELPVSVEEFHAQRRQEKQSLQAILHSNQPVIIFGCGSDGIRLLEYLRSKDELGRITCLTDNNAALHGTTIFGLPVLAPERARRDYPQACYLLASLNYGGAIRKQLLAAGVGQENLWAGHVC